MDEYAVSFLKTGAESGSYVLKANVFLTSLLEKMSYSMSWNLFHIFHYGILREEIQNERMQVVICWRFCLSVSSILGGTLALRAKTWVCLNEISKKKKKRKKKHNCTVDISKN